MRAFLLIILVLIISIDDADARRRRHHYRSYVIEVPAEVGAPSFEYDRRGRGRKARRGPPTVAALVPPNWQAEPPNPNWNGKRFLSPDGTSWLAMYKSSAQDEPVADHMRNIIFAKDETITYLRGERTWVVVSGIKESHVFYRKAILACAGKSWHHIAFEYPVELKARMDPLVISAARALDDTQTDCDQSVSATRQ
jgi:hypothetical protein